METLGRTPRDPRVVNWRGGSASGATIAVVPTMGALHAGHLALIAQAHDHASTVIVSIFVNPIQFDRAGDFDRYPRTLDDDLAACRAAASMPCTRRRQR